MSEDEQRILFHVLWTILYALMAVGAAIVFQSRRSYVRTLEPQLYFAQLFTNFIWCFIFFSFQL